MSLLTARVLEYARTHAIRDRKSATAYPTMAEVRLKVVDLLSSNDANDNLFPKKRGKIIFGQTLATQCTDLYLGGERGKSVQLQNVQAMATAK